MTVQVSRLVRSALDTRFLLAFNGLLFAACQEFDIEAYTINFAGASELPQNFYRGNRTLDTLNLTQEPDLPALAMWTSEGAQYGAGQRQMPTTFSGAVFAHWRFFLSVKGLRSTGLVDLREATESAMIAVLADEFSDVIYRGDLAWQPLNEQIWLDQSEQQAGFIQEVEYQASFEVIA